MDTRNVGHKQRPKRRTVRPKIREADWPVVLAFQDLQHAWLLQEHPLQDVSSGAVRQFERKSWDRLLRYLVQRPVRRD